MTRRGLALLALLALSQVATSYAADNYFEAGTEIFDKFMNDLTDSWHGLYKKHLPTGATGPSHFGFFKKGRLPLSLKKEVGATGAVKGPKHIIDEKIDAAASVKDFFQDALSTIKDSMDKGSKDFLAAAEARGEKLGEISAEIKDRVAIAYENTKMTTEEFLTGILGKDYKDYFPKGMDMTNWSQLGAFKFEGTFAEMVDLLNFDDVDSPKDLYETLAESDKLFCKDEIILPSKKVPTTCVGPSVSLELQPKTCVLDAKDKTLTCDPAKLVLTKFPGECTYKHKSGFFYKGKECKIEASIGLSKEAVIGGGEFSIDFEKTGATVTGAKDPLVKDT
ncbi:hypothetical protein Ndes2526B_g03719 [Nannochloris sp. 'desiccata']|nr:hypothetical protein KSW81_005416 [Chlorella desiccata (nom. nud.)]KAH7621377.1 hypothetical protein NADE_006640 [Chlorella desiccata (nom. nud.)]